MQWHRVVVDALIMALTVMCVDLLDLLLSRGGAAPKICRCAHADTLVCLNLAVFFNASQKLT
jgi:hypothetical protein